MLVKAEAAHQRSAVEKSMPLFTLEGEHDSSDEHGWETNEEAHPVGFGSAWARTTSALNISLSQEDLDYNIGRSTYSLDAELSNPESSLRQKQWQNKNHDVNSVPAGALLKFQFREQQHPFLMQSQAENMMAREDEEELLVSTRSPGKSQKHERRRPLWEKQTT